MIPRHSSVQTPVAKNVHQVNILDYSQGYPEALCVRLKGRQRERWVKAERWSVEETAWGMETARRKARLIHNQSENPCSIRERHEKWGQARHKQEESHNAGCTVYQVLAWTPRWWASGALRPVLKYSVK